MSFVVDAIKKVGRWIDDNIFQPIKDVGSWINEKIFKPEIKFTEMQIQNFLDDPLKAIATAIAAASGNPAAWLAVVNGVDTALEGGDIGDILESAAKGYLTGKAGKFAENVGDTVGYYAGDAFGGTVGNVVSKVVTSGTAQAIDAIADGRDPLEAFKMGAISTGVGLTLGKINTELEGKYDELPDVAKNVIQASITDLVINGEVSELTLSRAITNSIITAQAVDDFLDKAGLGDWTPDDATDRMNEGTLGTITAVIQNTVAYAAAGESGSDAFGRTLVSRVVSEAVKSYQEGTLFEDMQDTFSRLSGKYTAARENGEAVDAYVTKHQAEVEEYNEIAEAIGDAATEVQALEDAAEDARGALNEIIMEEGGTKDGVPESDIIKNLREAVRIAEEAFNTARSDFEDNVTEVWNPRLTELNESLNNAEADYNELIENYTESLDELNEATVESNEELAPRIASLNEAVATQIAPDADWEFYQEQNGFDTKEEAIQHYLSQGLASNAPTTQAALDYNNKIETQNTQNQIVQDVLDKTLGDGGERFEDMSLADKQKAYEALSEIAEKEGVSIEELDINNDSQFAGIIDALKLNGFLQVTTDADGNQSTTRIVSDDPIEINYADGLTNNDLANGTATLVYNNETGKYDTVFVPQQPMVHNGQIIAQDNNGEFYIEEGLTGEQRRYVDGTTGAIYTKDENGVPIPVSNEAGEILNIDSGEFLDSDPSENTDPEADTGTFAEFINDNTLGDTLQDLAESSPQDFVDIVNEGNLADTENPDYTPPSWLLEALQDGADYLAGEGKWEVRSGAADWQQNLYANGVRAFAGMVDAFGGLVDRFNEDDPTKESIRDFAADMEAVGKGALTEGYNDSVTRMQEFQEKLKSDRVDDPNTPIEYYEEDVYYENPKTGERVLIHEAGSYKSGDESKGTFWTGMQDVFKTAANHPSAFFGEYIVVEFMQEAVPLVIGGLGTLTAKAGISALKTLPSNLAKELSEEATKSITRKVGLTSAAATDIGESIGANYAQAYEEAYATALKMANQEADALELSGEAREDFLAGQEQGMREYALGLAINTSNKENYIL